MWRDAYQCLNISYLSGMSPGEGIDIISFYSDTPVLGRLNLNTYYSLASKKNKIKLEADFYTERPCLAAFWKWRYHWKNEWRF